MVVIKRILSGGVLFGLMFGLSQSWAQEGSSANASSSDAIEEIVVVGIRSSLRDAIGIKRSYVGTVDAVAAEDFGKFPDGNLAESLARVSGIAIDRSNVEGQKVAVRGFGPEYNLVTLNGRQMPTAPEVWVGGRSFNFGDIASPGVAAVEVFKSANSLLPSGGIGATVNMVTTRPLNVEGTKKSVSLGFVEDTTSAEGGLPVETAFLYATNKGRWGFSLAGSYQERTNREEGTREANWITVEEMAGIEGYNRVTCCWGNGGADIVDNNQRADGYTFYQEPSAYQIKDNDRTRQNLQARLQFAITDDLVSTVDYTYSNVDFSAVGVMFGSWLGGWDTLSGTINERGAFTDVVVGNRAYDHELIWQSLENENKSVGFNLSWDANDAWHFELDAHSSSAAVIGGELNNSIGFTTDVKTNIHHTNGGGQGINSFSYDYDFMPENFYATGLTMRDGYKENDMQQFQLYGAWNNINEGFISSIHMGVSRVDNDFSKVRQIASYSAQDPTADQYDDSLFVRTGLGSFMDSFSPPIGTSYYYQVDPAAAMAAFSAANGALTDPSDGAVCCGAGDVDHNDRVFETLESVFLQVNMKSEFNGMPLDIIAGARYETSDTESISFYPVPTTLRWDMIAGLIGVNDGSGSSDSARYGSSSEFLPSLSMSLGLDDNQVVRVSASKTMARPDLFALSSQLDIAARDFFQPTASGGNPDLKPLTAENFDLSYENYYGEESYFAVNYFRKNIDNFIGTRTVSGVSINGMTDPTQSAIGQYAMACVREWVAAGRPDTGFPGEWGSNHCVSQQALWAQGWMNDQQHMGWVALGMANGADVSGGYPYGVCQYDGWWRCDPGYIDGTASDPLAMFEVIQPYNMEKGTVSGFEFVVQHVFDSIPFGFQFNFTKISGGDVDIDRDKIGEQFILPGLGDSGNFSVFFENEKHTARIALNYRGETVAGFGNYTQPLYVDERKQVDFSYQYRYNESQTYFFEVSNLNDESTRLYARYPEMLFLSQDHGPVIKFGARMNF